MANLQDDTSAILNDFDAITATISRKSTASSNWDSAGAATWTSTTVASAAIVNIQFPSLARQFLRDDKGNTLEQFVMIYLTNAITVLPDDLINDGSQTFQVEAVSNRWTGHQELRCKYVRGSNQP